MLDISGQRFGKLVAIEPTSKIRTGYLWKCQCDCGNETQALAATLRYGKKVSCGCLRWQTGDSHVAWTGRGEIPGSYLFNLRHGAKVRGYSFNVTPEELWECFLAQNRRCALSGVPIGFGEAHGRSASVDRKDSSLGYGQGNIWWVHKDVNLMKQQFGVEVFIEWAKKIANEHPDPANLP